MTHSSFLTPPAKSEAGSLAILHLRRDHSIATTLFPEDAPASTKGYAEGVVTNTRFGSFPHSTLVDVPWGSQVPASKVDTGSRGRPPPTGKKRKLDESDGDSGPVGTEDALSHPGNNFESKQAVPASSGFLHVMLPTPENWTTSLPHRTQVVYTPDYSYILHRIRARPGTVLIEAGSGSGSFTHAAARAVFSGYKDRLADQLTDAKNECNNDAPQNMRERSHVFSFEFNQERYDKLQQDMVDHGLSDVVTVTHRDVYNNGFLLSSATSDSLQQSPSANAIFLDLPAPWQALPHLTRNVSSGKPTPLDAERTVHICTFSPCIEQAQKTVSALRRHGWLDIEMVEVAHKRLEVRREYTGLQYEGMRNVNPVAVDVDQAVGRLREVVKNGRNFRQGTRQDGEHVERSPSPVGQSAWNENGAGNEKLLWKEGRLVHRTEPDLRTHTSYLVFALLPRQWTEQDEMKARKIWRNPISAQVPAKSKRQLRKQAKVSNLTAEPSGAKEANEDSNIVAQPPKAGES
ncbi:MAG: hypothetical protein Q9160_001857 [Pyrenula sp. 1 TL-2023]